jgi:hypothetical protein
MQPIILPGSLSLPMAFKPSATPREAGQMAELALPLAPTSAIAGVTEWQIRCFSIEDQVSSIKYMLSGTQLVRVAN